MLIRTRSYYNALYFIIHLRIENISKFCFHYLYTYKKLVKIELTIQYILIQIRLLESIMASANFAVEDSFLSHAERVYIEIREKFVRAHQILQNRETDLLAELQRLVDEYTGAGMRDEIQQLNESKQMIATLKGNQGKEVLDQSVALIDESKS